MKKLLFILLVLPAMVMGQIITTIAGGGVVALGDGGPAIAANLGLFGSVAVDSHSNIYIADANHQRIRKVDAGTGIISTIAGTGTGGYNGDNILAVNAQLKTPACVTVDKDDNIYISDNGNYRIRKVNASTGIITTYVGTGISGYNGDGISANTAKINGLQDIAFDSFGNLYFVDGHNYRIRKVDVSGMVSTIAGTGVRGHTNDGGLATAANITGLLGIGVDKHGDVYFTDSPAFVRKVDINTGILSTVASTGSGLPYNGDEILATTANIGATPTGLSLASA